MLVYVSASWCEPCKYFQQAVNSGKLPDSLKKVTFLKFDHDRDDVRLSEAGYGGRMLPRFVVPGASGFSTDRRFEGSIKGPGAVDNIVPRLEAILQKQD
jgi:hypothetical protein